MLIPAEAAWLATFLRELLAFPRGRFDDQVDALSQLLNWHGRRRRESVPAGPVSFTPDPFTGRTIIAGDAWWLDRQSADERDQPDVLRW